MPISKHNKPTNKIWRTKRNIRNLQMRFWREQEQKRKEMEKKGLIEGEHYRLRTPNSYQVKTKSGV